MIGLLAIDIGGTTRNGFAVRNLDGELLAWDYLVYDSKTRWEHRQKICKKIEELNDKYIFDTIMFEKINLHRRRICKSFKQYSIFMQSSIYNNR